MGSHAKAPLAVRAWTGTLKQAPLPKPETLKNTMGGYCARPQHPKSTEYTSDTDTDDGDGNGETGKQPRKE